MSSDGWSRSFPTQGRNPDSNCCRMRRMQGRWLLSACLVGLPALAAASEAGADDVRIAALRQQALAHELGSGVPKDIPRAFAIYCRAARLGDAASQFDLGWMYAHGRGVNRDDAVAAFFFQAAAAQGVAQATHMLSLMGAPSTGLPECLREPVAPHPENEPGLPPLPRAEPVILAPKPIADLVLKMAPEFRVSAPLVFAIMEAESNFNSVAVSPKNAQGLMQLIPETAVRFRVKNPFDPAQNVRGGMAYLRWLLAYFEGDVAWVAAAYNAGERAVERHLGVPPYAETRAYVRRIVAAVGPVAQPYDASIVAPSVHLHLMRQRQQAK